MGLQSTLKELEEQLAAAEAEEAKANEEVAVEEEAPKDEPEEEIVEEEAKEPEAPEEEEKKVETKDEEPADNAAWAKMRREAAAAKRKAEEAEAKRIELELKLAEVQARLQPQEEVAEAPRAAAVPPEVEEIIQTHRMVKAEQEFKALEDDFRKSNPGYDAVAAEYAMALAQSIKIQNRHLSQDQVVAETKKAILMKASNYINNGYDPIEELYHEARELGFTGRRVGAAPEPKEERALSPDLKKVAANRERSSGMAGASGKTGQNLTPQVALSLTVQEFAKLSPDQQAQLAHQLRG